MLPLKLMGSISNSSASAVVEFCTKVVGKLYSAETLGKSEKMQFFY